MEGGRTMAVKLRLTRLGKKKQPHYRLIATDARNAAGRNYIEELGKYNPNTEPPEIDFKEDRIRYWLSTGAQPSETVNNLLKSDDIKIMKKR